MKKLTLTSLLLFLSSFAYSDDITEWGELVSVEQVGQGSDVAGSFLGRVTLRVNDVDTVYLYQSGLCTRPYGSVQLFQNLLMAPYLRVRFRTKPAGSASDICIVGFEMINEKFLVP
jgi:hypothetical protein